MTLNLTELRDEPLGKHPMSGEQLLYCSVSIRRPEQDVVAADDESSFTFDVDGLSDEALDPDTRHAVCILSLVASHDRRDSHRIQLGARSEVSDAKSHLMHR